ncbi:MAG: SDR family oxidoreductase [Gemmatimonadaceae bacterium]|nr:SDR family oxidoreductase [Acetobacteraceae bacterium]
MTNIALITGGSRGLGRNTAISLARTGTDVILTYQSRADDAQAVVAEIAALGRTAVALQLDIGHTAGFAAFADQVRAALHDRWGQDRFDHLVNNAGGGHYAPFAETEEAAFDQLVAVHLKGVFFLTQTLLPLLRDGGRIVNISSGLARFSLPGFAAYAAMKGGVEVLTRYMAKELGARGITVNTVAPGAIETDFAGGTIRDNPDANRAVAQATALGRAGLPDDIGPMIASLLSPGNGWINGQRIEASGGAYL